MSSQCQQNALWKCCGFLVGNHVTPSAKVLLWCKEEEKERMRCQQRVMLSFFLSFFDSCVCLENGGWCGAEINPTCQWRWAQKHNFTFILSEADAFLHSTHVSSIFDSSSILPPVCLSPAAYKREVRTIQTK